MAFVGMEWIVVIVAVVLLLFGAKKIPDFARSLGRATGEFRRGKLLVEKEMRGMERDLREAADAEGDAHPRSRSPSTDVSLKPRDAGDDSVSPIRQAARDLGIPSDGRSDEELKGLIRAHVTGQDG